MLLGSGLGLDGLGGSLGGLLGRSLSGSLGGLGSGLLLVLGGTLGLGSGLGLARGLLGGGELGSLGLTAPPNLSAKRWTRPPVSTSFCWPV